MLEAHVYQVRSSLCAPGANSAFLSKSVLVCFGIGKSEQPTGHLSEAPIVRHKKTGVSAGLYISC